MKKISIIILTTFLIMSAGCSERTTNEPLQEKNGLKYVKNETEPFTGVLKLYHSNGKPSTEIHFKDGKLNGLSTDWNQNGEKISEIIYKDGIRIDEESEKNNVITTLVTELPATIRGIYSVQEFEDCCFQGNTRISKYNNLQLLEPVTVTGESDTSEDNETITDIVKIQISDNKGFKNGDLIDVHCEKLYFSSNGHYALPVYCSVDSIKKVNDSEIKSIETNNKTQTSQVCGVDNGRFIDNNDGTITDRKTNLMWKKCSQGQSGADCSVGVPLIYNVRQIYEIVQTPYYVMNEKMETFAGYSDWRIAQFDELYSIVEKQCFDPAINSIFFPNTPSGEFVTFDFNKYKRSMYSIDFYDGEYYGVTVLRNNYHLRLVRPLKDKRGEFKQTTQKFHRILGSVTLLCSHQMILFEPIV